MLDDDDDDDDDNDGDLLLGFAITSITIQVYIFANYKVGKFHGKPLPKSSKLSHVSLAVGISTSLDSSVA